MTSFVKSIPLLPVCLALLMLCLGHQTARASETQSETHVSIDGRSVRVLDLKTIGATISLHINQEVAVRVEALKAAGFLWSAQSQGNAVVVLEVKIPRRPADNKIEGAPEPQYFLLRGAQSGSSKVEFRYGRPHDDEGRRESVSLSVNVN